MMVDAAAGAVQAHNHVPCCEGEEEEEEQQQQQQQQQQQIEERVLPAEATNSPGL